MSRRSSRLVSKAPNSFSKQDHERTSKDDGSRAAIQDHLSDMDENSSTGNQTKNPKKRRKISKMSVAQSNVSQKTKPVKGKRGRLALFPEMPTDILFEIFSHLRPSDLLRLARTTKALRNTLLRRSARSIWKDSLTNTQGLPACPEDLNEPQFASLAFDPFCRFCDSSNTEILWAFRLRTCEACIGSRIIYSNNLAKHLDDKKIDMDEKTAKDLIPAATVHFGKFGYTAHLATAFDELCETLEHLKNDPPALEKFLHMRKTANDALQWHSWRCGEWFRKAGNERRSDLNDVKQRRKDQIFCKLRDDGWGDVLDDQEESKQLANHALVKKPQDLTDRIWNNIKSELIEYMKALRDKHLAKKN